MENPQDSDADPDASNKLSTGETETLEQRNEASEVPLDVNYPLVQDQGASS